MPDLEERIILAQADPSELNRLLVEYLPFLKSQVSKIKPRLREFDDMMNSAMLSFTGCVLQYKPEKGAFIPFLQTCIRNRLIDENRKEAGHPVPVPLNEEVKAPAAVDAVSILYYNREQENFALREEIASLSAALKEYGVVFNDLPHQCPRQKRSRMQCVMLARYLVTEPELRDKLCRQKKLPQKELAERFSLSVKTVEKHRKYIVTLAVVYMGDYPYVRTFLPCPEEEGI